MFQSIVQDYLYMKITLLVIVLCDIFLMKHIKHYCSQTSYLDYLNDSYYSSFLNLHVITYYQELFNDMTQFQWYVNHRV